jgi:hypothetical protein
MKADIIVEIGINDSGQLYIKPQNEQFTMIWRSATEVNWNEKENYLYSPKPGEWSYLDWYKHIVAVVRDECNIQLHISVSTVFVNLNDELKQDIIIFDSGF